MRVKKFFELADFDTTVSITKDNGKTIESPNERELNKKVKYFEIKNNILILHI